MGATAKSGHLETVSTDRGSGWVRQPSLTNSDMSTSQKIARRLNLLVETITYVVMYN